MLIILVTVSDRLIFPCLTSAASLRKVLPGELKHLTIFLLPISVSTRFVMSETYNQLLLLLLLQMAMPFDVFSPVV